MNEKIDWREESEKLTREWCKDPSLAARIYRLVVRAQDARAEEIANELYRLYEEGSALSGVTPLKECYALRHAADVARSTIKKPETREARLEEALREIINSDFGTHDFWQRQARMRGVARRALEEE